MSEIERTKRILVIADKQIKAGRDRLSGALRYFQGKSDILVTILHRKLPGSIRKFRQLIRETPPDGLLFTTGDSKIAEIWLSEGKERLPAVAMDFDMDPKTSKGSMNAVFSVDDRAIGLTAAKLLSRRGYRHFGYAGLASEAHRSDVRAAAFETYVEALGYDCRKVDINMSTLNKVDGLAEWVKSLPKPCGVMAYFDQISRELVDACKLADIKIPDEIALVGVDDETDLCETAIPSLSSILPDFNGGGYLAAEMLYQLLQQGEQKSFPAKTFYGVKAVVERRSTCDLRGGSRIVSLACEHIRRHACDGICVTDVSDALHISRRLLEFRFRQILGRTVREEIEKVKLRKVEDLLLNTTDSIKEIGYQAGFRCPSHLKAVFKKRMGCSMLAFRKMRNRTANGIPQTR